MGILTAAALVSSSFLYNVYDVPATVGKDCEEVVFDLGASLETKYGVHVLNTSCDWQDPDMRPKNSWVFKIEYEADEKLNLVSTKKYTDALNPETYKTKTDCEAALEKELPIFAEKTGLNPFVYYCKAPLFPDSEYPESGKWQLVIESFGMPQEEPYTASIRLFETPTDLAELNKKIYDYFTKNGATVVQTYLKKELGMSSYLVRYYAKQKFSTNYYEISYYKTKEECALDSYMLGEFLTADSVISVLCAGSMGGSRLGFISGSEKTYKVYTHPNQYQTQELCKESLQTIIDKFRSLGKDIVAAVCSYETYEKTFKPVLLENTK